MVGLSARLAGAQAAQIAGGSLSAVLYVLVGIQASGNSTWASANAHRLQAVIVASDEIRNELEAAGIPAEREGDRVFAIFEARVAQWLDAGRNVIADATHARRPWRANVLAIAGHRGVPVVAVGVPGPPAVLRPPNAGQPGGGAGGGPGGGGEGVGGRCYHHGEPR